MNPRVSIVIPVYNEIDNLDPLWARLEPVVADIEGGAEVIVVDDGSRDGSLERLREIAAEHPELRVVALNRNYGQHAALMTGFRFARGDVVVTLDADLQNFPEDIPRLLEKIDEGYDVVGGVRARRRDTWFRRFASRLSNRITRRTLGVPLSDFGCMLRAYARPVVDGMLACQERSTFIPALACTFGRNIVEIPVQHAERQEGQRSRYSFWKLLLLQADLATGFSLMPLRLATLFGLLVALASVAFGIFLGIRRLIVGPENEGVFTLFAILFFFTGLSFLALGIMGEYVGRIYTEVRQRPRAVIQDLVNVDEETARAGIAGSTSGAIGVGRLRERTRDAAPSESA